MIDWKHWFLIKDKIHKNEFRRGLPLQENAEYLSLDLIEYFLLNRSMHYTMPKHVMWIGGFSNLDFFIAQKEVRTIEKCTNIDPTPAHEWCTRRHTEFIKYVFRKKEFDNSETDDVDYMWAQGDVISQVDLLKMPSLSTLVVDYYSNPLHIDTIKKSYGDMPRRIVTDNIAIYTKKDCKKLLDDILKIKKLDRQQILYKTGAGKIVDCLSEEDRRNDDFEIYFTRPPILSWDERIKNVN